MAHCGPRSGASPTGFHSIARLTDDPLKVNDTIGRCIAELELAIVDDDGRRLPRRTQGEIAAKGPSIHLGYLDNEQANRESFNADGWFLSGDLGEVVDHDGNVRISGRKEEIINRGGKKYFPREIEEILHEHPAFLRSRSSGCRIRASANATACAPYSSPVGR